MLIVLDHRWLDLCSEVLQTEIWFFLWKNTYPAVPLLEITHVKSPWLTVIIFILPQPFCFPAMWDHSQSSKLLILPRIGIGFYVLGFFQHLGLEIFQSPECTEMFGLSFYLGYDCTLLHVLHSPLWLGFTRNPASSSSLKQETQCSFCLGLYFPPSSYWPCLFSSSFP